MRNKLSAFKIILLVTVFTSVSNLIIAQIDSAGTITGRGNGVTKVNVAADSVAVTNDTIPLSKDHAPFVKKQASTKFDYTGHSAKKATWMSAALPSLGQFYNRRYWKPPIIYAAFGVSLYFLIDNQMKFITARNSFRGRLNIEGYTVAPEYESLSADQILADRDFYRSNRDYSIIAVGAVYLLNVIDAAVDAHLRTFDVSDDLSLKFRPTFQISSPSIANGFGPVTGMSLKLKF